MAAGDVAVNITSNNARAGAKFDGVDDQIDVSGTTLDTAWTISFWAKIKDEQRNSILGNADSTKNYIYIRPEAAHLVFEPFTDGRGATLTFTGTILNIWKHYTITATPTAISLYIDGVLGTNSPQVPTASDIQIVLNTLGRGYTGVASSFMNGLLSDMKIWNRDLTQAEVTKIATDKPINNGLIHHWKLHNDYTDSAGSADGSNDGSYLTIEDGSISSVISGQRVVASASGAYIQTGMKGGQIVSVAITETP